MDSATDVPMACGKDTSDSEELEEIYTQQRPCPIPKPAVMVGKALGFKQNGSTSSEKDSNVAKPP